MDSNAISAISVATAPVATIVGPLVTIWVFKRQFSASVISAHRQRWIETWRDTLAELSSQVVGVSSPS